MYCKMSLHSGSFPLNAKRIYRPLHNIYCESTSDDLVFYLRASTAPLQDGLWKMLPGPDAAQHLLSRELRSLAPCRKIKASHPPRQPSPHAHFPMPPPCPRCKKNAKHTALTSPAPAQAHPHHPSSPPAAVAAYLWYPYRNTW